MSNIHRKEDLVKPDDIAGFDYRTHVINKQTRKVSHQPYRMVCTKGAGTLLERPIGSGKFYREDGSEYNVKTKDGKIVAPKIEIAETGESQDVTS